MNTAAIDIGVGYTTKFISTGLMNLGLSPEMVMGIHILTNLAYMGYNMSKASKVVDVDRAGFGTNGQEVSYVSDFFEGADDGIVRGSSEVKFYSVENAAGGKTYVSTDTITQKNFSDIVNTADGKITIITGAHGTVDGTLLPEKSFFDDDVLKWGNNANVTVVDVSELDIEDLSRILNGSGTNICAWCYSERSNSVLQALVFGK